MKFKKVEELTGVSRTTIKKWSEGSLNLDTKKTDSGAHLFRWEDVFKIAYHNKNNNDENTSSVAITIANNKGGVGKTSSAHNIAKGLSFLGKTIMIDLDGQSNLTQLCGIDVINNKYSIIDFFEDGHKEDIVRKVSDNLFLVPSSLRFDRWKKNNAGNLKSSLLLKKKIKELKKEYRYIVIDTPPALDLSLDQALYASDFCIISLQAEYLAVEGMQNLLETINDIRGNEDIADFNLQFLGVFLTMYEHHKALSKTLASVVYEQYSDLLFDSMVRRSESIKQSQASKLSTYEFDEACTGAEDYFEVTMEILERISREGN